MITGFRFANGGAQEFFGITPDLATFGKGLANGYPLSAITGRADIMKYMEEVFFSFTFGGETLSLIAALTVLKKLEKDDILGKIREKGDYLFGNLKDLIAKSNLSDIFSVSGYPVWSSFRYEETEWSNIWEMKTLYLQEMFSRGIFIIGTHNLSYSHSEEDIDHLLSSYKHFFELVNRIRFGESIQSHISGKTLEPLFKLR